MTKMGDYLAYSQQGSKHYGSTQFYACIPQNPVTACLQQQAVLLEALVDPLI